MTLMCCSYFLSGSHDSTVTVWDVHNLMPVTTHHNYDAAINDASFSHDSQLLALGGEEQVIKINETMTGQPAAACVRAQHSKSILPMPSGFGMFWELEPVVHWLVVDACLKQAKAVAQGCV